MIALGHMGSLSSPTGDAAHILYIGGELLTLDQQGSPNQ